MFWKTTTHSVKITTEKVTKVLRLEVSSEVFVELEFTNGVLTHLAFNTGRMSRVHVWFSEIDAFIELCKILLNHLEKEAK